MSAAQNLEHDPMLEVLNDIKHLLKRGNPDTLMTVKDVADYLNIGESTFMQEVLIDPDFPEPVMVTHGQKGRRWVKAAIDKWVQAGGFVKKKLGRPRKPRIGTQG